MRLIIFIRNYYLEINLNKNIQAKAFIRNNREVDDLSP